LPAAAIAGANSIVLSEKLGRSRVMVSKLKRFRRVSQDHVIIEVGSGLARLQRKYLYLR